MLFDIRVSGGNEDTTAQQVEEFASMIAALGTGAFGDVSISISAVDGDKRYGTADVAAQVKASESALDDDGFYDVELDSIEHNRGQVNDPFPG